MRVRVVRALAGAVARVGHKAIAEKIVCGRHIPSSPAVRNATPAPVDLSLPGQFVGTVNLLCPLPVLVGAAQQESQKGLAAFGFWVQAYRPPTGGNAKKPSRPSAAL